jgi:two-component system cell cycle response regulator
VSHNFPILLVEDNPLTQNIMTTTIRKAGNEVVCAENGKKAMELMKSQFFPIILADWMMPEINGLELCKAVRQNSNDLPGYVYIIMLTVKDSKEDIISGLEAGADDYLTKPVNNAELIARLNTGKRILELEGSLKRANEELRILSITDPLTGCYNRRYLATGLPHEIKRARRYNRHLSVVLCDIDHFKKVNDNHGHYTGDLVLKEFSACIRESIRANVDWIARYGGEEFLIVLPETDINGAIHLVERFRGNLRKKEIKSQEAKIVITASYGVTGFDSKTPEEKISTDCMIEMADKYLYQAKRAGGNMIKAGGF